MPLVFIAIGTLFLVAGIRGTVDDSKLGAGNGLISVLKSEFIGTNNFLVWMLALWVLGALGYIPGFKPVANALLVLVVIVMVITNDNKGSGGFFATLNSAIKNA